MGQLKKNLFKLRCFYCGQKDLIKRNALKKKHKLGYSGTTSNGT